MEIVGKLKYTSELQPSRSLKSELLHRYLFFPFFAGTSILNIYIYRERETDRQTETETERGAESRDRDRQRQAAFEAVLIISEIELAPE